MHPYSINNSDINKVYAISLVMCILLGWLIGKWIETIPQIIEYLWIVDVPSAFVLFGIIFKLIDVYLWKLLSYLGFILKTPNLNGIYEGELFSSNDNSTHTVKITIKQTLTEIRIFLKTENTSSKSEIASILLNEDENPILLYEYINQNINALKANLPMHNGLTRLSYNKTDKSLLGYYFTSLERKNYGEIKVKKI